VRNVASNRGECFGPCLRLAVVTTQGTDSNRAVSNREASVDYCQSLAKTTSSSSISTDASIISGAELVDRDVKSFGESRT
jgi:hypothetical protein